MNKTKEYIEELEKEMKGLDWILKKGVKTSITKTENNVGITFDIRLDEHMGLEVVLYKYYDEDPFYISYQLHSLTSSTWFVHQKKYYDEKDEVLSEIERRSFLFIKNHHDLRLIYIKIWLFICEEKRVEMLFSKEKTVEILYDFERELTGNDWIFKKEEVRRGVRFKLSKEIFESYVFEIRIRKYCEEDRFRISCTRKMILNEEKKRMIRKLEDDALDHVEEKFFSFLKKHTFTRMFCLLKNKEELIKRWF